MTINVITPHNTPLVLDAQFWKESGWFLIDLTTWTGDGSVWPWSEVGGTSPWGWSLTEFGFFHGIGWWFNDGSKSNFVTWRPPGRLVHSSGLSSGWSQSPAAALGRRLEGLRCCGIGGGVAAGVAAGARDRRSCSTTGVAENGIFVSPKMDQNGNFGKKMMMNPGL